METVLFWIVWGIISFWALKTFYYSFSKEKLERLRKSASGINLAIVVLTFLPWVFQGYGSKSGLTLALEGNILVLLFLILLISSLLLFMTKNSTLLKIASAATIANTFLLFILMYQLRPGTFVLTLYDIAPVIAVLLLLVGDVTVLLLWQQILLERKKKKN